VSVGETKTVLPRVGVVGHAIFGQTYERLDECAFEVSAVVPTLDQINPTFLREYDVMLVSCGPADLDDPVFRTMAARLVRGVPAIAVVRGGAGAPAAARIGFRGFVAREVAPDALTRTVRAVAGGEVAFPRATLSALFQMLSMFPIASSPAPGALTPRQRQIVALIAEGATDREIAIRLDISESTAHKHVQNALRRSRTKTRSQLVAVLHQGAGA
jgi:DNA-binding CsgD family transcriptional regulator